jgi:hypothetical protein
MNTIDTPGGATYVVPAHGLCLSEDEFVLITLLCRTMKLIGTVLLYGGVVSLLLGDIGIVLCAFTRGPVRGILGLIFPFIGFGEAMRRFPVLLWMWGGGIAAIVIGCLLS